MSATETPLFPDLPESLSPFAKWKRDNALEVWYTDGIEEPWTCCDTASFGNCDIHEDSATRGETEEEACEAYCLKFGVKHWSLQT